MDHAKSQPTPYSTLAGVLAALLALTGITVWASTWHVGKLHVWVALLIATLKSALVLWWFMHLKHEKTLIRCTFLVGVITLAILISFIFWDISFREPVSF